MSKFIMTSAPGCVAANGDSVYADFRKGTENKLLIFFQGGGVSWNEYTAARPSSLYQKNIEDTYYMIQVDLFSDLSLHKGIFEDSERNPFRNWNMLVMPYSTGGFHCGTGDFPYTAQDGSRRVCHHHGYTNFHTVLDRVTPLVPDPEALLVCGCSGGGFGAALLTDSILALYPSCGNVTCLVDSGFFPMEGWHNIAQNVWHAADEIAGRLHSDNITLDALQALKKDHGGRVKLLPSWLPKRQRTVPYAESDGKRELCLFQRERSAVPEVAGPHGGRGAGGSARYGHVLLRCSRQGAKGYGADHSLYSRRSVRLRERDPGCHLRPVAGGRGERNDPNLRAGPAEIRRRNDMVKEKTKKHADWRMSGKERFRYYLSDTSRLFGTAVFQTYMTAFLALRGVDLTVLAGVMLILKIIDAVDDVVFGYIIDKIKVSEWKAFGKLTGEGKYLPWFRLTFFLFPLFTIVFYLMPSGLPLAAKVGWFMVSYLLYDLSCTLCEVPMNSLVMTPTDNTDERSHIITIKGIVTVVVAVFLGILLTLLVDPVMGPGFSFTGVAIASMVICAVLMLPLVLRGKEYNVQLKGA